MPPSAPALLQVDLFADIACPWCYVGEKRLAAALTRFPGLDVVQRWHPFQLQPDLPPGMPWMDFARAKFGGGERLHEMQRHMRTVGAPEGIDFRFDLMPTAPNTFDAHRLILAAGDDAMPTAEQFFAAYFSEGANLNDADTLVGIATRAGLDAARARDVLATDAYADTVRTSQQEAARLGVRGVPFYVFAGKLALSGAQPVDVFADVIRQALEGEA